MEEFHINSAKASVTKSLCPSLFSRNNRIDFLNPYHFYEEFY